MNVNEKLFVQHKWRCKHPASKEYGTHMGPRWVIIWVLYGQPIWDRCGFCNRDSSGTHLGTSIWDTAPYRISHINRPLHIMHIE